MPITDLIPWRRKVPVRREEERPSVSDHPLALFQQNMNRLFDEFFRGFDLAPFGEEWTAFSPQVDVVETDNEIKVSAELPGLDDKDVEVSLARGMLTIHGEKKQEEEERGKNYYRAERAYGSFRRVIPVPDEVDIDKAEAVFQKGGLTITLPKTGNARARKKIATKTK